MAKMIGIRLPEKTIEKVKEFAEERGLAPATAVRYIVVEYFQTKK